MTYNDEQAYQRGLVLGLTLAEIILLIIFCLLLILGFLIGNHKDQVRELRTELESRSEALALKDERLQEIETLLGPEKKDAFDDLFKELKIARETANRVPELETQVQELKEKSDLIDATERLLGAPDSTPEEFLRKIQDLQEAASEAETMENLVDKDAVAEVSRLERELKTLQGQMKNLRRKLGDAGKGTEMPACWADAETGRVEYIFDVALTSKGLVVHDRQLPHRSEDQAVLPLESVVFGTELTTSEFRSQTRGIFDWSVSNECRFFVRVFDLTEASEKQTYKNHLRVLEEHFYKYVVQQDQFPINSY